MTTKQNTSKRTLIILFAVFFIPMIIAALLFVNSDKWSTAKTNKGALLNPILSVSQLSLKDSEGFPLTSQNFKGTWSLFYVSKKSCGKVCVNSLTKIRQVRMALGKERERISRVLVSTDSNLPAVFAKLLETELEGTRVTFLQQTDKTLVQGDIYLVDPLGNIMMQYRGDAPPDDMYKDLKHLLKASQIG